MKGFLASCILLQRGPTTFLLVCFVQLKESTCKTRKNVFYLTWKALLVLEIKKINFSDIQMSCPVMKCKTFYWITWEVDTVWWCNLVSLCNIKKEKNYEKIQQKMYLGTCFRPFLIFKEASVTRIWGGLHADFDTFW